VYSSDKIGVWVEGVRNPHYGAPYDIQKLADQALLAERLGPEIAAEIIKRFL
jgi:hypothetical protein